MPFGNRANQVRFEDVTKVAGLFEKNQSWGVYWGDYNGDNWPDAYLHGHQDKPVRLYQNLRNGKIVPPTRACSIHLDGGGLVSFSTLIGMGATISSIRVRLDPMGDRVPPFFVKLNQANLLILGKCSFKQKRPQWDLGNPSLLK